MNKYRAEIVQAIDSLAELEELSIGMHLELATQDYDKLDFVSDKELAHILKEYVRQQELSLPPKYEED